MINTSTNHNISKFIQTVDPVMEIFQQAQGRRVDESLQNIFPFLKTPLEPESSAEREDDDDDVDGKDEGEGSFCSHSMSHGDGYGLNPYAKVFVPSHLKRCLPNELNAPPEQLVPTTKTEATSTTALPGPTNHFYNQDQPEDDGGDHEEDTFNIQQQIFELLSQMGDEKLSLDSIKITLLPNGQGINMQFTTDQHLAAPGTSISTEDIKERKLFKESLCRQTALNLDITDQEKLANRPENVLVSQFLQRASELLSEKYEWNAPNATSCPKCAMICAHRSYTELEIEQQIEGIKAFEKFLSLTDSVRFPDLTTNKEFQELCCQLGLLVGNDQDNPSTLSTEKAFLEEGKGKHSQATTEFICGKIYRYDDCNGESTLVNQLEGDGSVGSKLLIFHGDDGDQPSLDAPPTTPAISMTMTGLSLPPSKPHKSTKAKTSNCGPTPRKNGKLQNEKINLNIQKMRLSAVNEVSGTAPTKKAQLGAALHPCGKKASGNQHGTVTRSSGTQPPNTARRQVSTRAAVGLNSNNKPQMPSSSTSYGSKATKVKSTKSNLVASNPIQKMIPRSTTASLMRQSAVKRRLSMLRGDSDSDVPLHEYLFK